MRLALALFVAVAAGACLSVDLAGHACPCVDGFVCVNDVCIAGEGEGALGEGEGGAGEGEGVAGEGEGEGEGAVDCPAHFNATDACGGAIPAAATLVKVCDDGKAYPIELVDAMGGASTCFGAPATASVASSALTGTLGDDGNGGANLALSGSVTFSVDVPASCSATGTSCLQPSASGQCSASGNECACTGVVVDETASDDLNRFGNELDGGHQYLYCAQGGVLTLREADAGHLGPILLFH